MRQTARTSEWVEVDGIFDAGGGDGGRFARPERFRLPRDPWKANSQSAHSPICCTDRGVFVAFAGEVKPCPCMCWER